MYRNFKRKQKPIEEKESNRWLEGYRKLCDLSEQLPGTMLVSISDREGDIYECFVEEINPPDGEEPITWLLLTSLPVDTFEQACLVVEYYLCRWQIEIYFKVLKSGCHIEDRQFETSERIKPCIALYMIVAWRVLFVTMLGRECPDLPCTVLFEDDEWKSVYMIAKLVLVKTGKGSST